jgi:DNA-binding NarL/FixJ family response regulator
MTPPVKILLYGDYSIFRSALRMFLEKERSLKVVGEASDHDKATEIAAIDRPDLILVHMDGQSDNETLQFLKSLDTPILLLVGEHSLDIYKDCLRMGISGLVLKQESGATLFKAIDKVYNGEIWFDRTLMGETIRQLLDEKQSQQNDPKADVASTLTAREKEVVELICKGLKNKLIAEKLFITETTVRHHLTSVFNKFDISSRLELVVYAFKHNLIDTSAVANGNGTNGSNGRNGHSRGVNTNQ